jgi:hypothetical protein
MGCMCVYGHGVYVCLQCVGRCLSDLFELIFWIIYFDNVFPLHFIFYVSHVFKFLFLLD